jgi:hypothetical protein
MPSVLAATCDTGTAALLALSPAALAAILGGLAGWSARARRGRKLTSESETSHDADASQDSAGA